MDASEIERTAVMGSGLMGTGIVQLLAQAGCHVYLVSRSDQAIDSCLRRVREGLEASVEDGLLAEDQVGPAMDRIEGTTSLEVAARDVQLAVESVVERLDVKQELFGRLDRYAPPDAILATNTSGLSIGAIAERVRHPERVLGSHFFYPHTLIPLVEVGCGPGTARETVETTVAFWKRCGKEPVVCWKDVNGFLANRLSSALLREATSLVSNGIASARDVDRAMRLAFGSRLALMGVLEQRDWTGLDVHYATALSLYPTLEDTKGPLPILVERIERGQLGVKTGKGFYDWTGRDVEALWRRRREQLRRVILLLREITGEEDELIENS